MATSTRYLSFCSRIEPGSIDALLAACARAVRDRVERVELLLSTSGGSVDPAVAAYNLLRGMPFTLVTHNVGNVNSMGNVLFLAGAERYACPGASFLFHAVGFSVSGRARLELRHLAEKSAAVDADQRRIASILAERTRMSGEFIEGLFTETTIRDLEFALERGIIHGVRPVELPPGADLTHLDGGRNRG